MTEQENIQELRNYFVYEIRRPLETNDPRKYIGVSHYGKKHGPKVRFRGHKKSSYYVGFFIRKYTDAQMYIIHDNLTKEEAYRIEKQLVPKTDKERKELNLLNETEGGGIPPTYETLSKEKQALLDKIIKTPGPQHIGSKPYRLLDPNGILHEGKCLQELCRKYKLTGPLMSQVNNGIKKTHKGWTSPDYIEHFKNEKIKKEERRKYYKLISPEGKEYEGYNMQQFCLKQNLSKDGIYLLVNNKTSHYKGWTNPNSTFVSKKFKEIIFIDPEGNCHKTRNISKFAIKHNLKKSGMIRLASGELKTYKGWVLRKQSNNEQSCPKIPQHCQD